MDEKKTTDGRTWYVCDPVKHRECKKRTCVHNPEAKAWACYRTETPAFAVLDENGEPMKATKELKLPVFRDAKLLARLSGKTGNKKSAP